MEWWKWLAFVNAINNIIPNIKATLHNISPSKTDEYKYVFLSMSLCWGKSPKNMSITNFGVLGPPIDPVGALK